MSICRSAFLPSFFCNLYQHRLLILQMIKREIAGRYRGSFLGLLWSFFNPVLMLSIYTFVFSIVFKSRWGQDSEDKFEFSLVLFAGLIVFNLFSECISRAPTLILTNINYVKKVIFPLEILPVVTLGSALFHAGVNLMVLLIFLVAKGHIPTWTSLLLPIILFPLLLLTLGLSWLLASIGVFIRDVGQFIGMLLTVLMFMSPIFYPTSALPEEVREYLFLNPLTLPIEQTRGVLIWGSLPDWPALSLYFGFTVLTAWAGLFWFEKTRKGFADVL